MIHVRGRFGTTRFDGSFGTLCDRNWQLGWALVGGAGGLCTCLASVLTAQALGPAFAGEGRVSAGTTVAYAHDRCSQWCEAPAPRK